jgi:hypothetical protein
MYRSYHSDESNIVQAITFEKTSSRACFRPSGMRPATPSGIFSCDVVVLEQHWKIPSESPKDSRQSDCLLLATSFPLAFLVLCQWRAFALRKVCCLRKGSGYNHKDIFEELFHVILTCYEPNPLSIDFSEFHTPHALLGPTGKLHIG